jgi:hypothetical protein
MRRTLLAAAAAVALAGLAACETATPYQALNPAHAEAGGYAEQRLNPDRWEVSFHGNSLTSRETVEQYLLYRAAELTVAQGYDWFLTDDRQTDRQTHTQIDPLYGPGFGYGWRPAWRFRGAYGWGGWGYGAPVDVRQYSRFEVSAEIVMGKGSRPGDSRALNAHEVLTNLGPHIKRPTA